MPLPLTIRRVILTGFMGAGKSTAGPLLAARLGWAFLDLDTLIEARAGMTIAGMFAQQGEAKFRALEAEILREQTRREDVVLALGGGALETASTREHLAELGETCVVFLDAPLETLVNRCLAQPGAAERPVLADREGLARRFAGRLPHYRAAHLIIPTEGLSPEGVAERILQALPVDAANTMKGAAAR